MKSFYAVHKVRLDPFARPMGSTNQPESFWDRRVSRRTTHWAKKAKPLPRQVSANVQKTASPSVVTGPGKLLFGHDFSNHFSSILTILSFARGGEQTPTEEMALKSGVRGTTKPVPVATRGRQQQARLGVYSRSGGSTGWGGPDVI